MAGSAAAQPVGARVDLHPVNRDHSGNIIKGEATIDEEQDGDLIVSGTAYNMDPSNQFDLSVPKGYISLFYDVHSTPDGPLVCEPTVPPSHPDGLTFGQMLGAFWTVDVDGVGTAVDLEEDSVDLSEIGTMSIRDLRINAGRGVEAVVACGEVVPASQSRH